LAKKKRRTMGTRVEDKNDKGVEDGAEGEKDDGGRGEEINGTFWAKLAALTGRAIL
jgi:hypothetical protein